MDASIMKLLEEDEDESMHSGADVDAFQAALNRDIGGGGEEPAPAPAAAAAGESATVSQNQPSDSASAVFPQGGSTYSTQSILQWPAPSQDGKSVSQTQEGMKSGQQTEQHSSQVELTQHGLDNVNQQQQCDVSHQLQQHQSQEDHQQKQPEQIPHQIARTTAVQTPQQNPFSVRETERTQYPDTESQYIKLQRMSNQQAAINEQGSNQMNRSKQVPFGALLPVIMPQLDKDRAMQLQTLYTKLKKNEIPKEGFVRHMKSIVGDQMLKMAVMKMQPQSGSSQIQLQSQASGQQQHLRMQSVGASSAQLHDSQSFAHLQRSHNSPVCPSYVASPAVKMQNSSSYTSMDGNAERTREVDRQSDSHGIQLSQLSSEKEQSAVPLQAHNKQQQQQPHFQYPQTSLSVTGGSSGSNYYTYPGANVTTSSSTLKPQPHDSQLRQIPLHHGMGSTQLGGATQGMHMMNISKFDKQNSINDPKRMQSGSQTHFASNSALQQNPVTWQPGNKEPNSGHLSSINHVKQEPSDQSNEQQNKPQLSNLQGLPSSSATHFERGSANSGALRDEPLDKQPPKLGFPASSSMMPPTSVSSSMTAQLDHNDQLGSRMPSLPSSAGINARTSPNKPLVGQKKPLEAPGSSPPPPSKKQKASGAFSDQSIEQLNDVTAVSGVNLREEEEQLFSGSKEDSRVSEASRRVVQEEEERLILQKTPLQKMLAEIMAKFGLKNLSNDVERCLSLCVEERLRGLVCNLIRLSKHRADVEKLRHRTLITSDVRQQIMTMNRKAREEWEKKQVEAEKLKKLNEPESSDGVSGEKEKDELRAKSQKVNKEEDEKMRTTAANVAARAAVGGDDMLSKWQLMAEQNRQKREGGMDGASGSHTGKDVSRKPSLNSGKNAREIQEAEKRGIVAPHSASRANKKFGRYQVSVPQNRVSRTISIKDVIAVLEREPQMSKSALIYRLYDKVHSETAAE